MKALILAAGYATRLYPLTRNHPKPLLQIGERTILDHFLSNLSGTAIDAVYIVTNARFAADFTAWADAAVHSNRYPDFTIHVINDGTLDNETRLGAIGDIQFVLQKMSVQDDLLISAGDNIYTFAFKDFFSFYARVKSAVILAHPLHDEERLKRHGIITVDDSGRVTGFEEKPQHPRSNLVAPAFYILHSAALQLLQRYLDEGNNPDAPGHFIGWLYTRAPVYAYIMRERYYDIGTLNAYQEACRMFHKP